MRVRKGPYEAERSKLSNGVGDGLADVDGNVRSDITENKIGKLADECWYGSPAELRGNRRLRVAFKDRRNGCKVEG